MGLEDRNKAVLDWLASLGYGSAATSTPMDAQVARWSGYIDRTAAFYEREERDLNGNTCTVKVRSCSPASLVDAEMASLIYNEEASITVPKDVGDGGRTDAFLQQWLADVSWDEDTPTNIERMCDTGTIGWALHVTGVAAFGRSSTLAVAPVCYDAASVLPLAWTGRGCTECAFVSTVYDAGEKLTQVEVHRPRPDGDYEIRCALFEESGRIHAPDDGTIGPAEAVNTLQPTPTFALARLAKRNRYWPRSPMGVALFDDLEDVLETVDLAFDSLGNDIVLGRKMVGVPESMLRKDEAGHVYTPWHDGRQFFLAQKDANVYGEGRLGVFEYNPSLRTAENREALSTALQVLGMRAGFGAKYFALDSQGGITTAKQVASDNADLMRTLRRHEKPVRAAIGTVIEAALGTYRGLSTEGEGLADVRGKVQVRMGDSVIQDTDSMREADRADVAAGLLEPWRYMVRWQGYNEEDAKAACEGADGIGVPLEA